MIGTHIGNYRIVTELGSGAMGEVYFAEHAVMGRRAAIKIIREELSTHAEMVQRFINEARLVNRIGHPNIVEITDFGEIGSRHYIMMEMLEGETLEERLEREDALPEPIAIKITLQVADALRAAHELGVVHRDLKPENIYLVNRPPQTDVVKVLDFGIAKLMHPTTSVSTTVPGAIIGTPHYMSPEQCLGDDQLDHRSDVYSLGVLLYRVLTGALPFQADSVVDILAAQINTPPIPPRELRPELSPRIEAIILKAIAKRPEDRFVDMRSFHDALSGNGFVVEPPPPSAASTPTPTTAASTQVTATAAVAAGAAAREVALPADEEADQSRRVGTRLARILVERIHKDKLILPAMPHAARECMDMLNDSHHGLTKVAAAIGRDPIIAPQVLRRAKSVVFLRNTKVRTLEQAVTRLGARQLRQLLVDLSARKLFESRNPAIRRATRNLWEHSQAVGVLSRAIARRRKDVDPDVAYLSGLLHDVGKPVAAALLLEAERSVDAPPKSWLASGAWLGVVNECHREVGVALARSWDLPEEILLAIARCERYSPEGP
ncbi:MAG TPA: HDOD domain-containing protein, partial [Polyangiales bacterium]|nr:HDOD domain-containing protein [Polyangiales bacterium]